MKTKAIINRAIFKIIYKKNDDGQLFDYEILDARGKKICI